LSLIFLVHPINSETVNYISDLQDILFFFFGIISFYIINHSPTQKQLILSYLLILFSVFSKETGIVFIPVILIFVFLYQRTKIYKHLLFSAITVSIYFIFRFLVAGLYFGHDISAPIAKLSLAERVINIPAIVLYYLQKFLFPKNLVFAQNWIIKSTSSPNFYLPLLTLLIICALVVLVGFYILKNDKKRTLTLFFFAGWFVLGIGLHIQLIPLDMTVADRWFYFPIVGLLGMVTVMFSCIDLSKFKIHYLILPASILLFMAFSVRTIFRNMDWKNNMTLYSHDVLLEPNNYILENGVGSELINQGQYTKALPYIQKSIEIYPNWTLNWNNLGIIYFNLGQKDEAKEALQMAISHAQFPLLYENLASILMSDIDQSPAKIFIESSLKKYPFDDKLWIKLALVNERLGKHDEALFAAQKAYSLVPKQNYAYILQLLKQNQPLSN